MDSPAQPKSIAEKKDRDQVRVTRRTLQQVLEQCRRALELLEDANPNTGAAGDAVDGAKEEEAVEGPSTSPSFTVGYEADEIKMENLSLNESDELCELLKSKVESPDFLEKLGSKNSSVSDGAFEEVASWNMIITTDIWEGNGDGDNESEEDGYILVKQEDIVDGIACFMTAYLLSLKQTKDLTPKQLQKALSKTFSVKKKKSKIRKAWDGSKLVYNVASWGATAIGIYQNPVLLRAASTAFWTSCRVVSKVL